MEFKDLRVGLLVEHTQWGLGKVQAVRSPYVWIYFPGIQGDWAAAVKQLRPTGPLIGVETAPEQSHPELDLLPPLVGDDGKLLPATTSAYRVSMQQALDLFMSKYQHCRTPAFLQSERDYKVAAHRKLVDGLGLPGGSRIAQLPDQALSALLKAVYHGTNIPSVHELTAMNDALDDGPGTRAFARAVVACLNTPSAGSFDQMVEALDRLPVAGSRVLTWPLATVLLFLGDPDHHMVLKPQQTQKCAASLGFDLAYDTRPNWHTYGRLRHMSRILLDRLRPLQAEDMIDVQSVMWVAWGAPYATFTRQAQTRSS